MATASLTTSPTQLDAGSSDNVSITNTGATDVTVARGAQSFTLRPTQTRVVYPEGVAVTAATVSGSGSVSYTATAARASAASQFAADPAFTGTYGPIIGSDAWLKLHAGGNLDALITGFITRDSNGAATSAGVIWPDGTTGTYTATTVSAAFPGAVDAYTVTYVGGTTRTVTQGAVTRDSTTGAVTARPAMTVA